MDRELIGYTCYYCKKHYDGYNPKIKEKRMCCFNKSEALGYFLPCKDGSEDHTRIEEKEVIKIYKR